jgi:TusA-related sulfurtransferase
MRRMLEGQTLEVHATDPTVAQDLAAWCRMTGNMLVDQRDGRYLLRKR